MNYEVRDAEIIYAVATSSGDLKVVNKGPGRARVRWIDPATGAEDLEVLGDEEVLFTNGQLGARVSAGTLVVIEKLGSAVLSGGFAFLPWHRGSPLFYRDVKSALSSLFCTAPYRYCLIPPAMEPLRVNSRLVLPPSELKVSFARSGGPGGQKVNKTASQVQLRFSVTESSSLGERRRSILLRALKSQLTASGELLIRAQRHREQARNLEDARERLAEALRGALKPRKARKATKPTRSSRERRMEAKRQRGRRKQERGGRYDP